MILRSKPASRAPGDFALRTVNGFSDPHLGKVIGNVQLDRYKSLTWSSVRRVVHCVHRNQACRIALYHAARSLGIREQTSTRVRRSSGTSPAADERSLERSIFTTIIVGVPTSPLLSIQSRTRPLTESKLHQHALAELQRIPSVISCLVPCCPSHFGIPSKVDRLPPCENRGMPIFKVHGDALTALRQVRGGAELY